VALDILRIDLLRGDDVWTRGKIDRAA